MRNKLRGIGAFKIGAANGSDPATVTPINKQATISMPSEDDGFFKQLSTLVNNPFDGTRALVNDARTSLRQGLGINNDNITTGPYADLTSLRRANLSEDEETKNALKRSSAMNFGTQVAAAGSGAYLAGQTAVDLIQGNPSAALLKLGKKVKPVTKLATLGYGIYKGNNIIKSNENKL